MELVIHLYLERVSKFSTYYFPFILFLPKQYLVLTEMAVNEVIVLDTLNGKVYRVDFEGGDEALRNEKLEETWENFEDFLTTYFDL